MKLKKAFTLIEMIIVIAIIGILMVALLPTITAGPGRARDAGRIKELQSLQGAIESYASDRGTYPASATLAPANCLPGETPSGAWISVASYFRNGAFPIDERNLGCTNTTDTPATTANSYYYSLSTTTPVFYVLGARMELAASANSSVTAAQFLAAPVAPFAARADIQANIDAVGTGTAVNATTPMYLIVGP